MGDFVTLNTALSAIQAGQRGLDVTTNNVANANTVGYTRQRLELRERPPYDAAIGPLGSGVSVEEIARLRDGFLDHRVRSTAAETALATTRAALLRQAEDVTGEPDAGVSMELDELWNAFEDLGNDPENPASQQQVVAALDRLTGRIRSTQRSWSMLAHDTRAQRDVMAAEVNDLLTAVADVNDRVAGVDPTTVSRQLLDERDVAIDRLAELVGADATLQEDGSVTLTVDAVDGRATLVDHARTYPISVDGLDALSTTGPSGVAVDVSRPLGGELAGAQAFLLDDLPQHVAGLDDFVAQLSDELNGGLAGLTLLTGVSAETVAPSPDLTAAELGQAAGPDGPHDGSAAQELAARRGGDVDDAARRLVVDLAGQVRTLARRGEAAGELHHAAQQARRGQHGVSLDEEMVQMVRFQRSLEAASRVMTAVDQALEVLVNRTGIVGR